MRRGRSRSALCFSFQRGTTGSESASHALSPAIEMCRLREGGVAAQQHVLEAYRATEFYGAVEVVRRAPLRGPIATAILDEQRLACIGERHQERVVAPDAVVREAHALLALAMRLHDRAVRVDARRLLEEARRLPLPYADANVVQDVHQRLDILLAEATAEVAGGRGVGDRARAERIEKRDIVATDLDVIEHMSAAHDVVGDVEHRVGFAVRPPALKDRQAGVERTNQPAPVCKLVHGTNAAAGDRLDAVGDFVTNGLGSKLDAAQSRSSPADETQLRPGRRDLHQLRRAHEDQGARDGPSEHREVLETPGRADRRSADVPRARPAVLEEPRAEAEGARAPSADGDRRVARGSPLWGVRQFGSWTFGDAAWHRSPWPTCFRSLRPCASASPTDNADTKR